MFLRGCDSAAAGSSGADSLSKQNFFDFTTYSRGVLADVARGGLKQDLTAILEETLVPRLHPYLGRAQNTEDLIMDLSQDPELASREMAGYQMLEGAFNIHSTSVKAWKAFLMSAYESSVPTRDEQFNEVEDATPYARILPSYSEALNDLVLSAGSGDIGNDGFRRARRWLGHHELADEQCELLAEQIVAQIRLRCSEDQGPFLSFGEFVNRRVGTASESFSNRGVLQTAIDLANDPNLTSAQPGVGVQGELFTHEDGEEIQDIDDRVLNPTALLANTADGSPATLLQGDLLQQIEAEAWCEAIVQRAPDFVDIQQSAGTELAELNEVNAKFGRRFEMVSFRWLSAQEI